MTGFVMVEILKLDSYELGFIADSMLGCASFGAIL